MSAMPYIVYLDPDTAFGEEVLMYADNAPLVTCDMCAKFDTRHCPLKVPFSLGRFCSEAVPGEAGTFAHGDGKEV